MHIKELFNKKKVVLSYELFPPKPTSPIEIIYNTLENLKELKPDYMSITYGAGGTESDNRTLELASLVQNKYGITPLAHLTAIHSTKSGVDSFLSNAKSYGIDNLLALRGDIRVDMEKSKDFAYASDLVKHIKQSGLGFGISGACYPEGHVECSCLEKDMDNLKRKVDEGVTHLNTQLFYDNKDFYEFINKVRSKGINIPIQAGIMPLLNSKQIERIVKLSGVKLPTQLTKIISLYGDNLDALKSAGISYACNQIIDLIANDAQGIHLYIMNNSQTAKQITETILPIIKAQNGL